jgi:Big-like domain-containing protein
MTSGRTVCVTLSLSVVVFASACGSGDPPAGPTTPAVPSAPKVVSVEVSGSNTLFERGQTQKLVARALLSNGFVEDRSSSATWQSSNSGVVSVSSAGVATAGDEGDATVSATVEGQRGNLGMRVKYAQRTPDPAPGQRLSLPDVRGFIQEANARRPELLAQSCPGGVKYTNNPWLDYIVDQLRTLDTRWGYNAKPTRSAADNGGQPVVSAGDEIAYHYGAGADQGSPDVYLIDILESHCTSSPRLTYRVFTGEEPGIWTGAGRF